MVALNDILGTALSGLNAAQAGLRSVSNNIANINTPGYAREQLSQSAGVTAGQVSGVVVGNPTRVADRFLEANVYRRAGDLGSAKVVSDYLDQLQSAMGAPGANGSIGATIDAIGAAAVTLGSPPASSDKSAQFIGTVQDALSSLQQVSGTIASLRDQASSQIGVTVDQINGLLGQIADLNDTVVSQTALGNGTAGAESQRAAAIEQLGSLVKITAREQSDGRVTIDTASGNALLDRVPRQLVYNAPAAGASSTSPPIEIRFAGANGTAGAATGESIASSTVGGTLGGLLDLQDRALPAFANKLGALFAGLGQSLNAASNAATTAPAPNALTGGQTALAASDLLHFSGAATFAVTQADGTLVASTKIDFSALGAGATVADAVAAINAGLGGSATASFANGRLTIAATGGANGVVVAQDATAPSSRGGVGFSQYFGLNDLVTSSAGTLAPSGFTAADPTGFSAGQSAQWTLRDASGRVLSSYTYTAAAGQSFGDLLTTLNQSPLGGFGSFAIDSSGRIGFQPNSSEAGATASIAADTTDRYGTGKSLSALTGSGRSDQLASARVRGDIVASPTALPLATYQAGTLPGTKAIGAADTSAATALADALNQPFDFDGVSTSVSMFATQLASQAGSEATRADQAAATATTQHDDAVNRRDSFSGVNIDDELSKMVVLQNSYAAAARVMSTASQMLDTLIQMVG